MEKQRFLFLIVLSISLFGIYLFSGPLSGFFVGFRPPTNATWWNVSWHYRLSLEINSSVYNTTDWPIEHYINFTDNYPSGTFDPNSVRVIEYDAGGNVLYEVPSQFDPGEGYASTNAVGEIVFIMNGTTLVNNNRTYYVYYDTLELGTKADPGYTENINYTAGSSFNINNTYLSLFIDTNRGKNTSGFYRSQDIYSNVIFIAGSSEKTAEYLDYSNYSHNLTFDLIDNYSFVNGTARLTVEQIGNEILFANPSSTTGEATVNKKYYIYDRAGPQQYGTFIKIKQRVTNVAGSSIQRNSTGSGALAFDLDRTLNSGSIDTQDADTANPYSWAWGSGSGGEMVGVLHLLQTGTTNYYALNNSLTSLGRVGIHLNATTINSGSYIEQTSLIYFSGSGGSDAVTEFYDIINRYENPINISQSLPEGWYVTTNMSSNYTTYNRNETTLITGNVSEGDPYDLAEYMNATIDMGTPDTGDDQTIIMYDDGLHDDGGSDDDFFANTFEINNTANVSVWSVNFTTYDNYSDYLNSSLYYFNVTGVLNVNVDVIDKKPLTNALVRANVTVRNYLQTILISGATINCSYNSTDVVNKTDYGDGNYSVNFTAPGTEGLYLLVCNATSNGNFGEGNDTFDVESSATNISLVPIPSSLSLSSITLYDNESFNITANASNVGNGTAYQSNISLELPVGWIPNISTEICNDIEKSSFCTKSFRITVPENTTPNNYYVNVSVEWRNPDDSNTTNQTTINVTVEPYPQLNLTLFNLSGEGADGTSIEIGNFTVLSEGNSVLSNISFNCYQGTVCTDFTVNFTPVNITSLNVNQNQSVVINVSVPLNYTPGNYTGRINVSAENDNYQTLDLNITVVPTTSVNITLQPPVYVAYFITQQNNETFQLNVTLDNMENGSARYSNISLVIPTNWTSSSLFESCGNIIANDFCLRSFNITVTNGSSSGNYLINITGNWTNVNGSLGTNNTSLNVTVALVPIIDLAEQYINGTVGDGEESYIDNFTVLSIGNGQIQNITFDCYQGTVCNNFTVDFTPASIPAVDMGENSSVSVNVTVPPNFIVGNYTGTVNVSAENDNFTSLGINISVPSNRTWNISSTFCQKSEYPDEGTACEFTIYNLGNDNITFNISPDQGNYTEVNITNFIALTSTNYTFNVTYNVTNVTQAPYNSTFIVNATDTNANPDNITIVVALLPYQPPIINFTMIPNQTEQNSTILVLANITDMSTAGLKWANVTIETPDGYSNTSPMNLYNSSGTFYQYNITYPDGIGNTTLRGLYNVTVYAEDNIGNADNKTKNFTVYTNLVITSQSLASNYLQGDTGSIYYFVRNLSGNGLSNVNVSFKIKDSTNNISHISQYQVEPDGYITPLPTFALSSDSITGNYTLFTNSTYYDSLVNLTFTKQTNSTFEVKERTITVTGLFADIETAVSWYPNNQMRFGILFYNGEGRPVDPDTMNLTIYDPDENVYYTVNVSASDRVSTGYYTVERTMGVGTANGMYLAVVNATLNEFYTTEITAFRVASGGPYDVRLIPFDYEVGQGDFFDFEVTVINMGTVSQDVFIEYNVTDVNYTQNYFYSSEAIYTPSLSNQTFTRNVYVFSNQPLGTYRLTVKVTFDYIQPPILANTTFAVIEGVEPPPPPPPPPPPEPILTSLVAQPKERVIASLLIAGYNNNVSLARGFTRLESVTVKNDGKTILNDVSLYVLGVPTDWFTVDPEEYSSLEPDDVAVFLVEYNIPESTIPGAFRANLLASSGVVSDQKSITIIVYESIKELLEKELERVKDELIDLEIDTKVAEREGKDVTNILLFINMTESYIEGAEDDIENNRPEEAMDKLSDAINTIKRAREILDTLKVPEAPPFEISIWVILIVFIVIIVIVFVFVFWKKKQLKPILRPYIAPLSRLVERVKIKEVDKDALAKEREKLSRMLRVLEKEKEEGIISSSVYTKMKKSIENKIGKIEKKIK